MCRQERTAGFTKQVITTGRRREEPDPLRETRAVEGCENTPSTKLAGVGATGPNNLCSFSLQFVQLGPNNLCSFSQFVQLFVPCPCKSTALPSALTTLSLIPVLCHMCATADTLERVAERAFIERTVPPATVRRSAVRGCDARLARTFELIGRARAQCLSHRYLRGAQPREAAAPASPAPWSCSDRVARPREASAPAEPASSSNSAAQGCSPRIAGTFESSAARGSGA